MPSHDTAQQALQLIERRWNTAARIWDPAALSAIYAGDAVFYGGRADHFVGRARIKAYFESYQGSLASVSLALINQEIRLLGPGVFLAQGHGDFGFGLTGGKRTENRLRTSLVIAMQDRDWAIMLHHFSAVPEVPPVPQ